MPVDPKDALPLAAFLFTLRADAPVSTRSVKERSGLSMDDVVAYRDDLAAKEYVHVEYVQKGNRPFPNHNITLTPKGEALQADLRRICLDLFGSLDQFTKQKDDAS